MLLVSIIVALNALTIIMASATRGILGMETHLTLALTGSGLVRVTKIIIVTDSTYNSRSYIVMVEGSKMIL